VNNPSPLIPRLISGIRRPPPEVSTVEGRRSDPPPLAAVRAQFLPAKLPPANVPLAKVPAKRARARKLR
jgi:hypothetical protein